VDTTEEREQLWLEDNGLNDDLLDAYRRLAWHIAYPIVQDPDEATDVADATMEELVKHPPPKARFLSYLRRIARDNAIDCYRSSRHKLRAPWNSLFRRNADDEEYRVLPESGYSPDVESEVIAKEDFELLMRQLDEGLRHCNSLQRVCFVLRYVEGMETREIAEKLEIPVGKVSTALSRSKKRIGKLLRERRTSQ
jgi:RNA polymerase sigma factor (sigma-70 family)